MMEPTGFCLISFYLGAMRDIPERLKVAIYLYLEGLTLILSSVRGWKELLPMVILFLVNGQIIQILPNKTRFSFTKSKIIVCILENNRVLVLYKSSLIWESMILKGSRYREKEEKIEKILDQREYMSGGLKFNILCDN